MPPAKKAVAKKAVPRKGVAKKAVAEKAVAKRTKTEARAESRKTLDDFLTLEQRSTRKAYGYFDLIGSEGGKYRIYTTNYSGNVRLLEGNVEVRSFCAHVKPYLLNMHQLYELTFIAQLLRIKSDEKGFRRIARG